LLPQIFAVSATVAAAERMWCPQDFACTTSTALPPLPPPLLVLVLVLVQCEKGVSQAVLLRQVLKQVEL
jgi:hypothetical protein